MTGRKNEKIPYSIVDEKEIKKLLKFFDRETRKLVIAGVELFYFNETSISDFVEKKYSYDDIENELRYCRINNIQI